MKRVAPLCLVAVILAGCSTTAAPTPQIVYVTPAPPASASSPTPVLTVSPTPAPTPVPTPMSHRLRGTVAIGDHNWDWEKHGDKVVCIGFGGFVDIHDGVQVEIRDGADTVIGTGSLVDGGTLALVLPSGKTFPDLVGHCTFNFEATVPDAPFYTLKIGKRDAPVYSNSDLASSGWKVALTLGG